MTGPREQTWIAAAREGDQGAFEELVRLYEKRVLALTQRMCKNPEDAAEAAQEAFFAAWRGLKNFRGDSSFSTWIYRLASNACVDLLRREGKQQAAVSLDDGELNLDVPSAAASPQEEAERRELREQIEEGLRALPPEYRAALVLREIQQLRYDEIGEALGVDIGTVKSRINRGRKKLRIFLLERGNFSPPSPSKETGKEGRS
ncbi:MAG: sigma-70 family RNA polymerase sigma factor [Oscillibacter sp.]|jgi:RNA polymerase sigma-70 factor (ECF subfamily)|nr:sigma-70 family RNA polymerase sigma factor [uncultured Oscillibacter sp.]MCI9644525.1 sigma-70 family RNA polymerase sigma factor [Oscillibacter sp.]